MYSYPQVHILLSKTSLSNPSVLSVLDHWLNKQAIYPFPQTHTCSYHKPHSFPHSGWACISPDVLPVERISIYHSFSRWSLSNVKAISFCLHPHPVLSSFLSQAQLVFLVFAVWLWSCRCELKEKAWSDRDGSCASLSHLLMWLICIF